MKQIIHKNDDGNISSKCYINHLNQRNGLWIGYRINSSIWWKFNYINDKKFGVENYYNDNKPTYIIYNL